MPEAAGTFGGAYKGPSAAQQGYGHDHRKRRKACLYNAGYICATSGCGRLATIADHIVPHEGNKELQEDESNYQALCELCHAAKTGAENAARRQGLSAVGVDWVKNAAHLLKNEAKT